MAQLLSPHPSAEWIITDISDTVKMSTSVKDSIITVTCHSEKFSHENMVYYYMRALDLARGMVDVTAFSLGMGLSVHIFKYKVEGESLERFLLLEDKTLPPLVKSYDMKNIRDITQIVMSNPAIFMAMNDLILAITLPHHSPVNCARAVEGIRHLIAGSDIKAEDQWNLMRTALNVDKAYLKMLTDTSANPRHGNREHIIGSLTREITQRAWIIMDRFLQYKKGNDKALTSPEYPLLVG
jgi:hypothetical protein